MLRGLVQVAAFSLLVIFSGATDSLAQERGYLGVQLDNVTPSAAQILKLSGTAGAFVVSAKSGAPAERAGLAAKDVILALDNQPMANMADTLKYLATRKPGESAKMLIWRDGARQELTATLDRFPEVLSVTARRRSGRTEEICRGGPACAAPDRAQWQQSG